MDRQIINGDISNFATNKDLMSIIHKGNINKF